MTTAGDQGRKIKRGTQDLLLWLTGVGILHWHYWQDHQLGYCFIPAEEMLGMVLNHPELLYLQPTVLMSFLNRKQQHLVGRGCGEKLDLVKRKTVFRTKPSSLCALCRGVRTTKKKTNFKRIKNIKHKVVHSLQDRNNQIRCCFTRNSILWGRQIQFVVFFNVTPQQELLPLLSQWTDWEPLCLPGHWDIFSNFKSSSIPVQCHKHSVTW